MKIVYKVFLLFIFLDSFTFYCQNQTDNKIVSDSCKPIKMDIELNEVLNNAGIKEDVEIFLNANYKYDLLYLVIPQGDSNIIGKRLLFDNDEVWKYTSLNKSQFIEFNKDSSSVLQSLFRLDADESYVKNCDLCLDCNIHLFLLKSEGKSLNYFAVGTPFDKNLEQNAEIANLKILRDLLPK